MTESGSENGKLKKGRVHPVVLVLLILAGTAAAFWLSAVLPTSGVLALAAVGLMVTAAAGLWRLWMQ